MLAGKEGQGTEDNTYKWKAMWAASSWTMQWKDVAIINRISLIWLHKSEPKSKWTVKCSHLTSLRKVLFLPNLLQLFMWKQEGKKNKKFVFLRKIPVLEHLTVREWELVLKSSSMCCTNKRNPCKNTHRVSVLDKETETLLSPQEQQIRDTLNKRKQRTSVKRQVQWVMFWQDALEALLTRPLGGHTIFEPLIMFASQICI